MEHRKEVSPSADWYVNFIIDDINNKKCMDMTYIASELPPPSTQATGADLGFSNRGAQ